ncbi:MAG: FTR1 family protein [Actinomycetes bacterium]
MSTANNQPETAERRSLKPLWWALAIASGLGAIWLMATAETGPVDPSEATRGTMSHGTVVFNSTMIVFREGLEAVLILAAVTASFLGCNRPQRRPVFLGALVALLASVVTWFAAGEILAQFTWLGMRLEAITGFIAIVVLLIVLNWFVHKVYWTGWIARHHRKRRELLADGGRGVMIGLVALGFTSVYREGFETVLFLQNLRVTAGSSVVLEGVAIGSALTAIVGLITFRLQQKLPYKKMLIITGVMIGIVLVVMVGGTAATFQDLGWLPRHEVLVGVIPIWMGSWFEVYPTVETLAAQALAAAFVIGSYYLAEYMKVTKPKREGKPVAQRAEAPPAQPASAAAQAELVTY